MSENVSVVQSNSATPVLETAEEYRARKRQERQLNEQKYLQEQINTSMHSQKENYIEKYDSKISEISIQNTELEQEKKEDGSSKIRKKTGKGLWGKIKRFASNFVTSAWNITKGLLGFDENGDWDAERFGKNLLTAGAIIGVCSIPYIGPVIGYGLLAHGVYEGAKGTKEGYDDLKEAKTDEEIDAAQQKICSNFIVGALSCWGLRGIGKAFRTNPVTAAKASAAKVPPNAGALRTARAGVSNFVRDITYNALRGTLHEAGMGFKALRSLPRLLKRFKTEKDNLEQPINEQIAELNSRIASETNDTYKALLKEELHFAQLRQTELSSLDRITQTQLQKLRQENSITEIQRRLSSYKERGGEIIFKKGGKTYKISKDDAIYKQFIDAVEKSNEAYSKNLNNLISMKERIMAKYAKKPKKYKTELDEYTQMRIRSRYTNPEALENGIADLEARLATYEREITRLEERLDFVSSRTSAASKLKAKRIRTKLKKQQKLKTSAQEELALCKTIKFKRWYKPSTWRKNKYQLAMNNSKTPTFGITLGQRFIRSGSASYMGYYAAQVDPKYTDAYGYVTDLTPEQTEQIIDVMTKYSDMFKEARQKLHEAQDDEQIEQLCQAYDALNEKYQQEIDYIISGESQEATQEGQSSESQSAGSQAEGSQAEGSQAEGSQAEGSQAEGSQLKDSQSETDQPDTEQGEESQTDED